MSSSRRVLPVVRWLQVGAAAAGLGMALGAAPAVAWADEGPASSASDSAVQSTATGPAATDAPGTRGAAGPARVSAPMTGATRGAEVVDSTPPADMAPAAGSPPETRRAAGPARVSAQTTVSRATRGSDVLDVTAPTDPAPPAGAVLAASAAVATSAPAAAPVAAPASTSPAASTPPLPVSTPAQPAAAVASPTQPKVSTKATAATPSAAPGLGSFGAALRLNLEDLFSGGAPKVANPTAVVTGMFNQVLRRDPTATELQNYVRDLNFFGVNAVVAGLYTSEAFRQNSVNNYYLELLGRTPTQQELFWGGLQLALGTEPNFAASLAGSRDFYNVSASGGGKFGTQPSATTYVDLLYRSLLGQSTGPSAAPLVQQIQGGLPISWAAIQFVNTDAYRTVKVGEVYQVLGQAASPTDVAGYVRNWLWSGGQAGISMSLLATTANVQRIEAGLVPVPNTAAAADLQKLLLSAYTDSPEGFTKLFNELLSLDPSNPIGGDNPCTPSNTSCNQALYALVTTGGRDRGIPNSSLKLTSINANVSTLVPTQNEIDLRSSLRFPLQDPEQLKTYFAGGVILPFGLTRNPVVTANNGTYIVDGHHRWSSIYLINPVAQVVAVDMGYVPNPQTALKEAQMGVMAAKGYLASATVQGENLYTITEPVFREKVRELIEAGSETDEVLAVFGSYLGFNPVTTPLDEQYDTIQSYLWGNVTRMRELNPFIPGAPSRSVMPQTDPLPVWQTYINSGDLSYSFPTISYLG